MLSKSHKKGPYGLVIIVCILFVLLSFSKHQPKTPENGTQIPPFCAINHLGEKVCFPDSDTDGNKLTLIQFWASWCGTCKQPNQEIQKLVSKYQDSVFTNENGMQLVTISLDKDTAKWKQYIVKNQLDLGNHFCDTLAWKGKLIQKYGISYLPYTFLVDGEGKIISQGLFGSALEAKIIDRIKR